MSWKTIREQRATTAARQMIAKEIIREFLLLLMAKTAKRTPIAVKKRKRVSFTLVSRSKNENAKMPRAAQKVNRGSLGSFIVIIKIRN
jgi:hypothetical protein